MIARKILFINLGYARGIDGRLSEHVRYAYRHFYCAPFTQKKSLKLLGELIEREAPDLCCFVEIDQGAGGRGLNQLDTIKNDRYPFSDIENKYGRKSIFRSFALTAGKSNAFMARRNYDFEKLFFTRGIKRLVYKIRLDAGTTIFFAHFSLNRNVRAHQILEARNLMRQTQGEVIFLGDFNILSGLAEIEPLLDHGRFALLNPTDFPTFFFHKQQSVLDLCLCSAALADKVRLRILPQPFTDHAALILDLPA